MPILKLLPVPLLAAACLGVPCAAQEAPYLGAFKLSAGTLGGDVKKALDFGATYSFAVESAFPISDRAALVGELGYRYFPGGNQLLSFIPVSVPASGVNPTIYETRNRRTDAKGFQLSGLYRYDLLPKSLYLQGGLRVGFNKTTEVDTGTQLVTDGAAIANTGTITNAHILAVRTIAGTAEKKTVALGLVGGVGYRFLSRYAAEFNAFTTRIESAAAGTKNGFAAEFSFSVQF